MKFISKILLTYILTIVTLFAQNVGVPFIPVSHSSQISYLDKSENILISGSMDSNIKVWDIDKKMLIKTFTKHQGFIKYAKVIPKKNFVVSVDNLNKVYLWDMTNLEVIKEHTLPVSYASVALASNTNFLLLITDKKALGFNIDTGESFDISSKLPGYYGFNPIVKTDESRKSVLVSFYPDTLKVFDFASNEIFPIKHQGELNKATISNSNNLVAGIFENKELKIWNKGNGKVLNTIDTGLSSGNDTIAFSPNESLIAISSGFDVHIWDIKTSKKIYEKSFYQQIPINAFSFYDDKSFLIGLSGGNINHVYIKDESKSKEFPTYNKIVSKVDISKDGNTLYSSINSTDRLKYDNRSRKYYSILDYVTSKEIKLFHEEFEKLKTVQHLNDKEYILGGFDGDLSIWDIKKKKKVLNKKIFNSSVSAMSISSDLKNLALISQKGILKVFEKKSFKELFSFDNKENYPKILKHSLDDKYLILIDSDSLKVWDTNSWNNIINTKIDAYAIADIKLTKDNSLVFLDNTKSKLQRYNIKNQKFEDELLLDELFDKKVEVEYLKFSNDYKKVLVYLGKEYFVIDLEKKELLTKIDIPFEFSIYTTKLHFTHDDKNIAITNLADLHIYNIRTSKEVSKYNLYTKDPDEMLSAMSFGNAEIAFSSNSQYVVSTVPKTHFPKYTADKVNIWNTDKLSAPKKISASRYTLSINDFVVNDKELLYGSNGSLSLLDNEVDTKSLKKYYGVFKKVKIYKQKYILALEDNKIILIDYKTKKTLHEYQPLSGIFTSATFTPDGKEIIATSANIFPKPKNKKTKDYTVVSFSVDSGDVTSKTDTLGWWGANSIAMSSNNEFFVVGANSVSFLINMKKKTSLILEGQIGLIKSIAINKQNSLIATASSSGDISLWDISTGKKIHTFNTGSVSVNSLVFHPSKEFLISGSSDGTVKYWNIKTKELIATFASFDNEWIVITKEGYFNGSINAAKRLNILFDEMNVGDIEQIYDTFFRPDLVNLKLQGIDISKYINKIDLKQIVKNTPPKVFFTKVDDAVIDEVDKKEYFTAKTKAKLSFKVDSQNGGVGNIKIYQEGKLVQTIGNGKVIKSSANIDLILEQEEKDLEYKQKQKELIAALSKSVSDINLTEEDIVEKVEAKEVTNEAKEYEIDVDLKAGDNIFSIQAFNKSNTIASVQTNINIKANIPKEKPNLYAVVFGVNEFEVGSVTNLKYSQKDATDIKNALEYYGKSEFDKVNVDLLIDKDATWDNLVKSISKIQKQAKLDDTVTLYMSTHGRATKNGKLFLVPQNNKRFKNWISFERLFKTVQSTKALKQIFVIDACESGQANNIVASIYDSKASVLAKSAGVHMLMATTKGTFAFEHPNPEVKNGVFTYNILNTLKQNSTDLNKDGKISVIELSKNLKKEASSSKLQYPVIRNIGNDIDIKDISLEYK